jgi:hypothetical protein
VYSKVYDDDLTFQMVESQPEATTRPNIALHNGEQLRWIHVKATEALGQILAYVNDVACTKVSLEARWIDIWTANLKDGDILEVTGKGLGGAEMMVKTK